MGLLALALALICAALLYLNFALAHEVGRCWERLAAQDDGKIAAARADYLKLCEDNEALAKSVLESARTLAELRARAAALRAIIGDEPN